MLAEDAINSAIADFKSKNNIVVDKVVQNKV
jgi:hypothetical protein